MATFKVLAQTSKGCLYFIAKATNDTDRKAMREALIAAAKKDYLYTLLQNDDTIKLVVFKTMDNTNMPADWIIPPDFKADYSVPTLFDLFTRLEFTPRIANTALQYMKEKSQKKIAVSTNLKPQTVKGNVKKLYSKLNVNSRQKLITKIKYLLYTLYPHDTGISFLLFYLMDF